MGNELALVLYTDYIDTDRLINIYTSKNRKCKRIDLMVYGVEKTKKKGITGLYIVDATNLCNLGLISIEDAYEKIVVPYCDIDEKKHKTAYFRFYNVEITKTEVFYAVKGTMGLIDRYPILQYRSNTPLGNVMMKADGYTVLGVCVQTMPKEIVKWKGTTKTVTQKIVPTPSYFVITPTGIVGRVSKEQAVRTALNATITNATLRGSNIYAIHKEVPFIEMAFTRKPTVLLDASQRVVNLTVEKVLDTKDLYILNPYITANQVTATKVKQVSVTATELQQYRACFNLYSNEQSAVMSLERWQQFATFFQKATLYGWLEESEYKFMQDCMQEIKSANTDTSLLRRNVAEKKYTAFIKADIEHPTFQALLNTCKSDVERAYNIKTYAALPQSVRQMYVNTLRFEPKITKTMQDVVSAIPGAELKGLDHKVKSPLSLAEKILERERLQDISTLTAVKNVPDVLRYTIVFDINKRKQNKEVVDDYVHNSANYIKTFLSQMQKKGNQCALTYFRNYWREDTNPYKGVNVTFRQGRGDSVTDTDTLYQKYNAMWTSEVSDETKRVLEDLKTYSTPTVDLLYEVQLHTTDSLAHKTKIHGFYEITRLPATAKSTRIEYTNIMLTLVKDVYFPYNVRDFVMEAERE